MVSTKFQANGCLKKQDDGLPSNTIGEFTIENHHYLILLLPKEPTANPKKQSEGNVWEAISHFKIQGQYCAIIEAEPNSSNNKPSLADILTKRELQIASLVALGRVNKQIAKQLHISEWTVASHIRRIFDKLGVDSRAAMVYHCASLIQKIQTFKQAIE